METLKLTEEFLKPKLASEIYDKRILEARARNLIEDRDRIEHDSWSEEPEINARTAIFEELTAKGHLSHIEFNGQPDVINQRTLQRLLNGWSDHLPKWEKHRRFNEIVEELTIQEVWSDIQAGTLPPDSMVITISNSPKDQAAPERLMSQLGYGVLNDKGMVRATDFENSVRTVDQISRSNSNDRSTGLLFRLNGLGVENHGSTGYLANQIIASKKNMPGGVVDIQRALDSLAGPNIIYGEDRSQPDLNVPEYEDLREVSAAREAQAEGFIKQLADFERDLNIEYKQGLISYEAKLLAIYQRRKELVNQIILLEPAYAKDARGEASAEYFERASLAMAAGNDAAGIQHLERALAVADPLAGAVCGGNGPEKANETQSREARQIYQQAKQERKNWKWKNGVCIVNECPTRPAKTEVGPCSVCRKCQKIFDNGDNPKFIYKSLNFIDLLIDSIAESNRKFKTEQELKRSKKAGDKKD